MIVSEPTPSNLPSQDNGPSSTAIFMVLRKMRAPLLVLIVTFAVSVFGLTLIPGQDVDGKPWRMDIFDAFYFMSYTASTIGYGEIPHPFSTGQRMWVTICIYLTVIAWAYAIGTVFSLLGDTGFKTAVSTQRFSRSVRLLREPFLLLVGFGQAGELLARSLDDMDRRLVVLDIDPTRIDSLELASFHNDVPGHVGDARNPEELIRAGLNHPKCAGVIALTSDDEANLAVVMAAALLRPDLPVVARTMDDLIAERMLDFGEPQIVDPFNLFGDELMLAVTAPDTARLATWLTSDPGTVLPEDPELPRAGRWVVCGYGRFGSRLVHDLLRHGIEVTVIETTDTATGGAARILGDATEPEVLQRADLTHAAAFTAATDNDTTNLSLIVAARRANPDLYLVARQNQPVNAPLFDSVAIDSVLVPTRLIAHEVLARIGDPMLWRFLQEARTHSDEWSADLLERMQTSCGRHRPGLYEPVLTGADNPALRSWLDSGHAHLGELLRDPQDRTLPLECTALLLRRGDDVVPAPGDDEVLAAGDQLLLACSVTGRRKLDTILGVPQVLEYVASGERIGNSWVWRALSRRR